jgi:hypothetical protein
VEKTWVFLVGMVVLRGMSAVMTPPAVSMPRVSGVTSMRSTSPRTEPSVEAPLRMAAWTAAP